MHSDLALASLPSFLTQILHSEPIFSPFLQFLSIFSPLWSFPQRHHLSVSGYNFCQYYLYLPFCSAPGEHVDTQWSCQPWQKMKKEKKHFRKKEKTKACGLLKAIQLVSVVAHTLDKCMLNFFKGAPWLKLWRGECSPNTQFKWWRALCSTHKPIQTAAEMLLKRQKERWGVVHGN